MWDMYEVTSADEPLTGRMLRGTLRKFGVDHGVNLLAENATDQQNCVRIAVLAGTDLSPIRSFLQRVTPHANVTLILNDVVNPVLSKLKVNDIERYETS